MWQRTKILERSGQRVEVQRRALDTVAEGAVDHDPGRQHRAVRCQGGEATRRGAPVEEQRVGHEVSDRPEPHLARGQRERQA